MVGDCTKIEQVERLADLISSGYALDVSSKEIAAQCIAALPSPWRSSDDEGLTLPARESRVIGKVMSAQSIEAVAERLIAEHYARAHTDMVGDAEYRAGYLDGIKALVDALRMPLPESPK